MDFAAYLNDFLTFKGHVINVRLSFAGNTFHWC